MANSSLQAIRDKVRKLTRSPSVNQLTDAMIDEYVNTFIMYDFPDTLRLFSLLTDFSFFCEPNVGTYLTDTSMDPSNLLYDFKNKYITVHPPVTIAGKQAYFTQSKTELLNLFPENSSIVQETAGDGVTTAFAGTLSGVPVQRNAVTFSSIDTAGNGLALTDDGDGVLFDPLYGTSSGTINYLTGAYTLNWTIAPGSGQSINSQTVPYNPGRPTTMLYFDDAFILRPIPDQPYEITFEAYIRPTDLIDAGSKPELNQWWMYIAYGASKYIFQDRMDIESAAMIEPELKRQERNVLRRTLVQQTNERTATIYTQQVNIGAGFDYWSNN